MTVRGSKNKVILYIAGICSIVFVILLYHNASQRLEEMEKLYDRCHLNEESLSAQLQVNLEYKVRLEKSLQQEKSEHSQMKDDIQSKLKEERQARERENLESINKFTALQQKYKFLQSQHEDVNLECSKLRQLQLSELEEKSRLEAQLQSLKSELKLIKENKDNAIRHLKEKNSDLQNENSMLKADKDKLLKELNMIEAEPRRHNDVRAKLEVHLNSVQQPEIENLNISSTKSSASANKAEQEIISSARSIYINTSTPMINPDAVLSQDKILNAAPVPQPQSPLESFMNQAVYENKENVGAKPEELSKQSAVANIINDFDHVPAIQRYKEKIRRGFEKNNNGGEVGDEGEPVIRNHQNKVKELWRDEEILDLPNVRHPAGNDISKKKLYVYQAEYEGKKEEGEDDDYVDPLDYQHVNEKNQVREEKANVGAYVKIPFEDKRESVMIQPK